MIESTSRQTARIDSGIPFSLRLAGLLMVGGALFAMPQISKAAEPGKGVPTSQKSCVRSMRELIRQSKGQAERVEFSTRSPTLTTAVIFVADGEVQIACDATQKEMTINRVLNVADDRPQIGTPLASSTQNSL